MTKPRQGPFDSASDVSVKKGEVLVDGPDDVAISMTPEAAAETSDRLLFAAAKARGQQLHEQRKKSS